VVILKHKNDPGAVLMFTKLEINEVLYIKRFDNGGLGVYGFERNKEPAGYKDVAS